MRRPVLYFALALLLLAPGCPVELLLEDCAAVGDEDGNGLADCLDQACASTIACRPEDCDNNFDDNNDGDIDCADADCANDPACVTSCGDNNAEGSEACDGTDLGGQSCQSFGFTGGQLQCNGDCTVDTSLCINAVCGDGIIDIGEDCEGADLGGEDCLTQGFDSGALACGINCLFDTSGCVNFAQEICNNNADEDGDSLIDCADPDCANALDICKEDTCNDGISNDSAVDNLVDCADPDCALDANCVVNPVCGDGAVNQGSEQCDGSDFDALTCQSFNFNTGSLSCNGACQVVTAGCSNVEICNNGVDDNDGDGLADCADPDCAQAANCPRCGDGAINQGSEQCDGAALGGQSCTSLNQGFVSGNLACNASCQFDTSGCVRPPEICFNGVDDDSDAQIDCADSECAGSCQNACSALPSISPNSTTTGQNTGHASTSTGTCQLVFGSAGNGPDVAFAVTVATTGKLNLSMTPNGVDLGLYVETSCGVQNSELACSDFGAVGTAENIAIPVTAGQQLIVFVDGFSVGDVGTFTLTLSNQAGAPENCTDNNIDNDGDGQTNCADTECTTACSNACAAPVHIASIPSGNIIGNTAGHADTFTPSCQLAGGGDVMYTFFVPASGTFQVNLFSATDMGFYLINGCLGAQTTQVDCVDALLGNATESKRFNLTPNSLVVLMVAGFNSAANGSFTLSIAP